MSGLGPERPREQRKMKRWRRRDLNTNLLEVRWRRGWTGHLTGMCYGAGRVPMLRSLACFSLKRVCH